MDSTTIYIGTLLLSNALFLGAGFLFGWDRATHKRTQPEEVQQHDRT